MDLIGFLEQVEVFRGLDSVQLKFLKSCCQVKLFKQGEKIFSEDEDAYFLWAVVDGQVELRFDLPGRETAGEMTISKILPGKVFGWSSLVPPNIYRLSAYCTTPDVEALQVDRDCLMKLFSKDPRIGYQVMSNVAMVIGSRFQQLQDELSLKNGNSLLFQSDW
jgi:CRP-like cAMP-binding protein